MPASATNRGRGPWDGFVVAEENALAHAAALALARGGPSSTTGSPLVLHGPSGTGKSRLINGLVDERLARAPGASIALITGEDFVAVCSEAIEGRLGWEEARGRFRSADLFALDGLHDLERAPWSMEELSATLDALEARGALVAATARVGPAHWEGWPTRLVGRFGAGLSVRVGPPGPGALRRGLWERAGELGAAPPLETIEAIAAEARSWPEALGSLNAWAWRARRGARPRVDSEAVDEAPGPALAMSVVAKGVARAFGLTVRDLKGPDRSAPIVKARHLAMYLAWRHAGASLSAIGRAFGDRDRASVRHAVNQSRAAIEADPRLAATCAALATDWPASAAR